MLLDRAVPGRVAQVRLVAHPVEPGVELGVKLGQGRVVGGGDDRPMDGLVELEVGEAVLALEGGEHLEVQGADLGDLGIRRGGGGLLAGQRLQGGQDGQEVADLPRAGIADHRAPVGQQLDQPLRRQDAQRLAHRGAGDLQGLADGALADPVPRLQDVLRDHVAQAPGDDLGPGLLPAVRRGGGADFAAAFGLRFGRSAVAVHGTVYLGWAERRRRGTRRPVKNSIPSCEMPCRGKNLFSKNSKRIA